MKKQDLEAFAREVAKGLKTGQDLNEVSRRLTKVTVDAALNARVDQWRASLRDYAMPKIGQNG